MWEKPEPVVIATDNDEQRERFAVDTEAVLRVDGEAPAAWIAKTASNDTPLNNATANAVNLPQHVPPAPQPIVDPYEGLDPALRKEIELLRSKIPRYNCIGSAQPREKRFPAR